MKPYEVIIAGYGPTGAVLANLLGRMGIRTIVLEKSLEIYRLPRAIHFDDEVMGIFQDLELAQKIARMSRTVDLYRFRGRDGRVIMEHPLPAVTDQGFARANLFHQPDLEAVLRMGVSRYPSVDVRLNHTMESIARIGREIQVRARDNATGEVRVITAEYLLACDGGSSPTRKWLGVGLRDLKHDEPWLVVDVRARGPMNFPDVMEQICEPARPVTLIPSSGDRRRFEMMLNPGEDPAEMQAPARIAELLRPWADPSAYSITRAQVYNFHALIASQWRRENVFLLGDAAHQTPPFLGQGMCAGIRDAANLAWKIAQALKLGPGPRTEILLDSYQKEREPNVDKIIRSAIFVGGIIQTRSRAKAFLRDTALGFLRLTGLSKLLSHAKGSIPPFKRGYFAAGSRARKPAGRVFIRPMVTDSRGGNTVRLDSLFGAGFVVVARRRPGPDLVRGIQSAGAVLIHLGAQGEAGGSGEIAVGDVDGSLRAWFARAKTDLVILRPDRYVYGVGARDLEAFLREARHTGENSRGPTLPSPNQILMESKS